jgi:hypothetical protein
MHTKGPLAVEDGTHLIWSITEDGYPIVPIAMCDTDWRMWAGDKNLSPETHDDNARLIAAAYTSYDRHCGERAVGAAEADLLGQALEALDKAVKRQGFSNEELITARAILALAKGEK